RRSQRSAGWLPYFSLVQQTLSLGGALVDFIGFLLLRLDGGRRQHLIDVFGGRVRLLDVFFNNVDVIAFNVLLRRVGGHAGVRGYAHGLLQIQFDTWVRAGPIQGVRPRLPVSARR